MPIDVSKHFTYIIWSNKWFFIIHFLIATEILSEKQDLESVLLKVIHFFAIKIQHWEDYHSFPFQVFYVSLVKQSFSLWFFAQLFPFSLQSFLLFWIIFFIKIADISKSDIFSLFFGFVKSFTTALFNFMNPKYHIFWKSFHFFFFCLWWMFNRFIPPSSLFSVRFHFRLTTDSLRTLKIARSNLS